jgi:hypothetical protein
MDSINVNFPVAQPDDNGNYEWMAIRAGADSGFSKDVEVKGDLKVTTINGASYTGGGGDLFLPLNGQTPMDSGLTVPGTLTVNEVVITGPDQFLYDTGERTFDGKLIVDPDFETTNARVLANLTVDGNINGVSIPGVLDGYVSKTQDADVTGEISFQGNVNVNTVNNEQYPPDDRYLKLLYDSSQTISTSIGDMSMTFNPLETKITTTGTVEHQDLLVKSGGGINTPQDFIIQLPRPPTYNKRPMGDLPFAQIKVTYNSNEDWYWDNLNPNLPPVTPDANGGYEGYGLYKFSKIAVAEHLFNTGAAEERKLLCVPDNVNAITNKVYGLSTKELERYIDDEGYNSRYEPVPVMKFDFIADGSPQLNIGNSIRLLMYQVGVYKVTLDFSVKNSNIEGERCDYLGKLIPKINGTDITEGIQGDRDAEFSFNFSNKRVDSAIPFWSLSGGVGNNDNFSGMKKIHKEFQFRVTPDQINTGLSDSRYVSQVTGVTPTKVVGFEIFWQISQQLSPDVQSVPNTTFGRAYIRDVAMKVEQISGPAENYQIDTWSF